MPASKPLEKLNIVAITDYRAENMSITVPIPTEKLHQLTNSGIYRLCIEFHPIRTSDLSNQWTVTFAISYKPLHFPYLIADS